LLIEMGKRVGAAVDHNPHGLTSREGEILALVSRGMSNKEAARGLKCAERPVKHHMTNIMQKFDVRNRLQAVLKLSWLAS
jgi:two-component system, NarL family, nitrate/nitrite response regulator NarL